MALLLSLCNRIEYYSSYVRTGKYAESNIFTHYGPAFHELGGKTLGIIGLGSIGRRVAETASALGMKIIYYSTTGKNLDAGYKSVSLEDLLKDADVVSIHCPLNENTRGLIGRTRLGMMKRSAVLINTGRGGVVDERDLALP
jgi:glycerate dehydrogenase